MVCLGYMHVAYFFLYLPLHKNNKQSRRFPRPDAGLTTPQRQAYGDELLVDRRLRPLYRNLKQSLNWVNEYRKTKPLGAGLKSIFTPVEFAQADSHSTQTEHSHRPTGRAS